MINDEEILDILESNINTNKLTVRLNRMIPEPDSVTAKEHVLKPKMTAGEYHKVILRFLLHKGIQITEAISEEQLRLLKEYAYRGSNLRYRPSNREID